MDGLEADSRRSIDALKKKEVMKTVGSKEEDLSTAQKNIHNAAKKYDTERKHRGKNK